MPSTGRKKSEQQVEVSEIMNAQRLLFDTHQMVHRTQLTMSNMLSEKYKARVYVKREDEQKGNYKKPFRQNTQNPRIVLQVPG
jgi:threonine dehydratase